MSNTTHSSARKNKRMSHYSLKRRERKMLNELLKPGETLEVISRGTFVGGRGLLIATNRRLILLDSKIMTNYMRTLQYDRIASVKHSRKFFESFLFISVGTKRFVFRSHGRDALRKVAAHIRYNTTPMQDMTADYAAFLQRPSLKSDALVPRHRHGKFSALPQ